MTQKYFEDQRQYEFAITSSNDDEVTIALFHNPRDLRDEVFGFVLSRSEAADLGVLLIEAADFESTK